MKIIPKSLPPQSDNFSRKITYLRISLTDRCNMSCVYCQPTAGIESIGEENFLRFDEIYKIIKVAVSLGIRKIRLTGGEPLLRKGIIEFIQSLKNIPKLENITLTTNGILLKKMSRKLFNAGVKRLNISCDSLTPDTFEKITRTNSFKETWAGIEEAEKTGFYPIKLNVVVQKGINDHELIDFVKLTYHKSFNIRFIEYMPVAQNNWQRYLVPTDELITRIEKELGRLEFLKFSPDGNWCNGPARIYKAKGALGVIGFISAISEHFCGSCNRLRLTADGKLRQCLFSNNYIDLKTPLRQWASEELIQELFCQAIHIKPKGHKISVSDRNVICSMSNIGG